MWGSDLSLFRRAYAHAALGQDWDLGVFLADKPEQARVQVTSGLLLLPSLFNLTQTLESRWRLAFLLKLRVRHLLWARRRWQHCASRWQFELSRIARLARATAWRSGFAGDFLSALCLAFHLRFCFGLDKFEDWSYTFSIWTWEVLVLVSHA